MRKRIAVTGIGLRASNALNYEDFVKNLENVIPGQTKISLFDTDKIRTDVACQIKEKIRNQDSRYERTTRIAMEAMDDFLKDSGVVKVLENNKDDVILSFSTSLSGNESMMKYINEMTFNGNADNASVYFWKLQTV